MVVIDDWGLAAAREQERHDLLEILEDRYDARSTITTSQIPAKDWPTTWATPLSPMPSSTASSTRPPPRDRGVPPAARRTPPPSSYEQRRFAPFTMIRSRRSRWPILAFTMAEMRSQGPRYGRRGVFLPRSRQRDQGNRRLENISLGSTDRGAHHCAEEGRDTSHHPRCSEDGELRPERETPPTG